MATGSVLTSCCTAAPSTARRQSAAWRVKRWSSPCAEMEVPTTAAVWASWSRDMVGLAKKPKTRAWTKLAPVSWRWRWMKPVE